MQACKHFPLTQLLFTHKHRSCHTSQRHNNEGHDRNSASPDATPGNQRKPSREESNHEMPYDLPFTPVESVSALGVLVCDLNLCITMWTHHVFDRLTRVAWYSLFFDLNILQESPEVQFEHDKDFDIAFKKQRVAGRITRRQNQMSIRTGVDDDSLSGETGDDRGANVSAIRQYLRFVLIDSWSLWRNLCLSLHLTIPADQGYRGKGIGNRAIFFPWSCCLARVCGGPHQIQRTRGVLPDTHSPMLSLQFLLGIRFWCASVSPSHAPQAYFQVRCAL